MSSNVVLMLIPFPAGTHIQVGRGPYAHHMIVGADRLHVIHFWAGRKSDNVLSKQGATVRQDKWHHVCSFQDLQAGKITVVTHKNAYSLEKSLAIAMSHLGKGNYNLTTNNCEHFATLCRVGRKASKQVQNAVVALLFAVVGSVTAAFSEEIKGALTS